MPPKHDDGLSTILTLKCLQTNIQHPHSIYPLRRFMGALVRFTSQLRSTLPNERCDMPCLYYHYLGS